jgi:hypothetical protein
MTASRRFETSLKRLECANRGHSQTVRRTGQVEPEARGPELDPVRAEYPRKLPYALRVGCARSRLSRNTLRTRPFDPSLSLAAGNTKSGVDRERVGRRSQPNYCESERFWVA